MRTLLSFLLLLSLPGVSSAQTPHEAIARDLEALATRVRGLTSTVVTDTASLQAALGTAPSGSTIELRPGAYTGPFLLSRPLTLTGGPGAVVSTPGNGEGAFVVSGSGVTLKGFTVTGRNTYDFIVDTGEGNTYEGLTLAGIAEVKRGIRLDGANTIVRGTSITNIWRTGQDSQGISGFNGPGPFLIEDNFIEAASENIMFGGADPSTPGLVPSDITIRRNILTKRLEWKGQGKVVKNLFELKNARRVLVEDNLLENNWTDGQSGWAVLFTPVNQDGGCNWCVVEDVVFQRNLIRGTEHGFNLTGRAYANPSLPSGGYILRENVIEASGRGIYLSTEVTWALVEGNVFDQGYSVGGLYNEGVTVMEPDRTLRPSTRSVLGTLTWRGNAFRDRGYGLHCEVGIGTACLTARTGMWVWEGNQVVARQYPYPSGGTTSIDEATFQATKAALLVRIGR